MPDIAYSHFTVPGAITYAGSRDLAPPIRVRRIETPGMQGPKGDVGDVNPQMTILVAAAEDAATAAQSAQSAAETARDTAQGAASTATTQAEIAATKAGEAAASAAEAAAALASRIREVHASTYSAIPAITGRALVTVAADETNDGLSSLYYYDGAQLLWIPTV